MRVTAVKAALAAVAVVGLLVTANTVHAQLSKDEIKCERVIVKEAHKFFATWMKTSQKCFYVRAVRAGL